MNTFELLAPNLVTENPSTIKDIDFLCSALWKEIGWHYPLDYGWILLKLEQMKLPAGSTVVDAGAGNGLLQFLLAYRGYNVISVDYFPRPRNILASVIFSISKISGENQQHNYISHLSNIESLKTKLLRFRYKLRQINIIAFQNLLKEKRTKKIQPGQISLYHADMRKMSKIETASIDAVVSASAVEHMDPDDIPSALDEFRRILKPGSAIIITTNSTNKTDWYHEPSKGWCFSEDSIRSLFGFTQTNQGDFQNFLTVLEEIRTSSHLKTRLSSLYKISGNNGMPWGIWDPQYLPVGIFLKK